MEEKNLSPNLWVIVTLAVAIIGCCGTIIGAAIGILPDLLKPSSQQITVVQQPMQTSVPPDTEGFPSRSPIAPALSNASGLVLTVTPWPTPYLPRHRLDLSAMPTKHITADGTWLVFTIDSDVNELLFHNGLLWAATDNGVVVWDAEQEAYAKYTTLDGLPHDQVNTLAWGPGTAFWFGTKEGASRYDPLNDTWQTFTYWNDGLANDWVLDVEAGPDGALWFGTWGGGLSRYEPVSDIWQSYTVEDGLVNNVVNEIVVGSDGVLWLGTNGGVSRYDLANDNWRSYTRADGLAGNSVRDMVIGSDSTLWIAHSDEELGVSRYNTKNSRWQTLNKTNDVLVKYVRAVAIGPNGTLWFSVDLFGLTDLRSYDPLNDTLKIYDLTNGSTYGSVRALEVELDGTVWIGTSNSLIRFKPTN